MNQFKEKRYAIVDIETTGSAASAARITEIAIFITDGTQILERFESLVNPEMEIPYAIQALTGISNELVAAAPTFAEIAPQIYDLLQGKIFVAHNVNFDYSFVRHQLLVSGLSWKASKLCTVRLSRKIIPGLPSYSLGKLCQSLKIPLENRHRAAGDALATVELFQLLLQQDQEGHIDHSLKQISKEQLLPNHVASLDFENLPHRAGIYIFKDKEGKIVYIGKAIDIKKRVLSHFTGNNTGIRRQQFLQDIYFIEFQESGTELMALLMECQLIKQYWPKFNRALKRFEPKYGLVAYEDMQGFQRLAISKVSKGLSCLRYFDRPYDANQCLLKLIEQFNLHPFLCQFFSSASTDKVPRQEQLANLQISDKQLYNQQVLSCIESIAQEHISYILIDQGRNPEEYSYIYVKDNRLYALGFFDKSISINDPEDLIQKNDYCSSNGYMMHLVDSYALQFPSKVKNISTDSYQSDYVYEEAI